MEMASALLRPGAPGRPSPPGPLSHAAGTGEHVIRGNQVPPETPGLPLRDRFRAETSPVSHRHGRGAGAVWAVPASPAQRCGCRFRAETSPGQMAIGEGEQVIRGRAEPSPTPPGCRGVAASRRTPPCHARRPGRPRAAPERERTRPVSFGHSPASRRGRRKGLRG